MAIVAVPEVIPPIAMLPFPITLDSVPSATLLLPVTDVPNPKPTLL